MSMDATNNSLGRQGSQPEAKFATVFKLIAQDIWLAEDIAVSSSPLHVHCGQPGRSGDATSGALATQPALEIPSAGSAPGLSQVSWPGLRLQPQVGIKCRGIVGTQPEQKVRG